MIQRFCALSTGLFDPPELVGIAVFCILDDANTVGVDSALNFENLAAIEAFDKIVLVLLRDEEPLLVRALVLCVLQNRCPVLGAFIADVQHLAGDLAADHVRA